MVLFSFKCAGEAEYIAYIPLKPGELFAVFVLAKKPLTTITHIDAKDALVIFLSFLNLFFIYFCLFLY